MGTNINWCDEVWNPTVGCTRVSDGCLNCYIERTMPMRVAKQRFDGPGVGATTGVSLHPERLWLDRYPLKYRTGKRIFVNSMSDLFHDEVSDQFIGSVFDTMGNCPQHTFLVLTKRPARARSLLKRWERDGWTWRRDDGMWCGPVDGPLPNVHLGVSAEDQATAELRIPILLDTPAAVRWVSAEPLLGPVRLSGLLYRDSACPQGCGCRLPWHPDQRECGCDGDCCMHPDWPGKPGIDWVVIGGESGPGANRMDLAWADDLVHESRQLGVAVWTKQLGTVLAKELGAPKAGDRWEDLPDEIKVRELPSATPMREQT